MPDLRLETVIRGHVEWVLKEYGVREAPRILGIGRSTLYRMRRKWKLPMYECRLKEVSK